jgi:hypothetical protein
MRCVVPLFCFMFVPYFGPVAERGLGSASLLGKGIMMIHAVTYLCYSIIHQFAIEPEI